MGNVYQEVEQLKTDRNTYRFLAEYTLNKAEEYLQEIVDLRQEIKKRDHKINTLQALLGEKEFQLQASACKCGGSCKGK